MRILDDSSQKATLVAGALISLYKPEGKPEKKESIRKKIQNKIIKNFRYQKQLKEYNEIPLISEDELIKQEKLVNELQEKQNLLLSLQEEKEQGGGWIGNTPGEPLDRGPDLR